MRNSIARVLLQYLIRIQYKRMGNKSSKKVVTAEKNIPNVRDGSQSEMKEDQDIDVRNLTQEQHDQIRKKVFADARDAFIEGNRFALLILFWFL